MPQTSISLRPPNPKAKAPPAATAPGQITGLFGRRKESKQQEVSPKPERMTRLPEEHMDALLNLSREDGSSRLRKILQSSVEQDEVYVPLLSKIGAAIHKAPLAVCLTMAGSFGFLAAGFRFQRKEFFHASAASFAMMSNVIFFKLPDTSELTDLQLTIAEVSEKRDELYRLAIEMADENRKVEEAITEGKKLYGARNDLLLRAEQVRRSPLAHTRLEHLEILDHLAHQFDINEINSVGDLKDIMERGLNGHVEKGWIEGETAQYVLKTYSPEEERSRNSIRWFMTMAGKDAVFEEDKIKDAIRSYCAALLKVVQAQREDESDDVKARHDLLENFEGEKRTIEGKIKTLSDLIEELQRFAGIIRGHDVRCKQIDFRNGDRTHSAQLEKEVTAAQDAVKLRKSTIRSCVQGLLELIEGHNGVLGGHLNDLNDLMVRLNDAEDSSDVGELVKAHITAAKPSSETSLKQYLFKGPQMDSGVCEKVGEEEVGMKLQELLNVMCKWEISCLGEQARDYQLGSMLEAEQSAQGKKKQKDAVDAYIETASKYEEPNLFCYGDQKIPMSFNVVKDGQPQPIELKDCEQDYVYLGGHLVQLHKLSAEQAVKLIQASENYYTEMVSNLPDDLKEEYANRQKEVTDHSASLSEVRSNFTLAQKVFRQFKEESHNAPDFEDVQIPEDVRAAYSAAGQNFPKKAVMKAIKELGGKDQLCAKIEKVARDKNVELQKAEKEEQDIQKKFEEQSNEQRRNRSHKHQIKAEKGALLARRALIKLLHVQLKGTIGVKQLLKAVATHKLEYTCFSITEVEKWLEEMDQKKPVDELFNSLVSDGSASVEFAFKHQLLNAFGADEELLNVLSIYHGSSGAKAAESEIGRILERYGFQVNSVSLMAPTEEKVKEFDLTDFSVQSARTESQIEQLANAGRRIREEAKTGAAAEEKQSSGLGTF